MPKAKIDPAVKALLKVCDTFGRAANIIDALPPGHQVSDETPLRDALPGIWPTVGEARKLRDEMVALGWTRDTFR